MDELKSSFNNSAHNNNYGNINANIKNSAGMSMHMHCQAELWSFCTSPGDYLMECIFNGKQVHAHHPFINSGANFNAHHQDVSKLGRVGTKSPLSHDNFQYELRKCNPSPPIYKLEIWRTG
ncbi:AVN_HP_G0120120.mRNA.1.CDS.1 [Saccharomyces cerevisiae]|nr:AVN_HP_G0120120.mRNA.1.CDS.1 [Saccharomyces cerevisiae]CAI6997205.1 AVN_HP_G0120120.mRNA.1.CDS.1 [Saccharomyces cerevisiae]